MNLTPIQYQSVINTKVLTFTLTQNGWAVMVVPIHSANIPPMMSTLTELGFEPVLNQKGKARMFATVEDAAKVAEEVL